MAKYVLGDKEVTEEEFYKTVFKEDPFFLDEVIYVNSFSGDNKFEKELLTKLKTATIDRSKAKGNNVFEGVIWISDQISAEESKKIEDIREACLNTRQYLGLEDVTEVFKCVSEEELESILKKDMSIAAPDWSQNDTGGTVFEKVQDSNLTREVLENFNKSQIKFVEGNLPECPNFLKLWQEKHKNLVDRDKDIFKSVYPNIEQSKIGKKETENKIDYSEINLEILDLMANRFSANKHKYPKGNSLKKLNKQDILWAAFRHIKKMIQPIEGDPESYVDHLAAVCTNMSIILDQLKMKYKNG